MSLLDSLDSTLENDKKPHTVQRTSGDMHTIPELTGERGTATRADSEEVRSGDNSSGPENDDVAVDSNRRPSATQIGFTLPNDNDVNSIHSANVSAKDTASKTVSGRLHLRFTVYAACSFRVTYINHTYLLLFRCHWRL